MSEPREILTNLLNQIDDDIESIENDTELTRKKRSFYIYVQKKIEKLNIRANILQFKYSDYKKYYDGVNILIIIISTLLTILESIKNVVGDNGEGVKKLFQIIPIIFSSSIVIIASILKFKKYQEKMEIMNICVEKCITTSYRLRRIREKIHNIVSEEGLLTLKEEFINDGYEEYLNSQEEIAKSLKYKDLVKHLQTYHNLNLKIQRSNSTYNLHRSEIEEKNNTN